MRFTAILLLTASLQISARGLGQTLTLHLENAPLQQAFQEIERQCGYSFVYGKEQLSRTRPVNLSISNADLETVLKLVFKDQPLSYTISGKYIAIRQTPVLQTGDTSRPQPVDIHGRVIDSLGNPLNGAFIQVEGTNRITSANENGDFTLKGVDRNSTLVISFVGYASKKVSLSGQARVSVVLQVLNKELSRVTVGYNSGFQMVSPEKATGSYSYVDNQLFNRVVSSDVLSRLQGVVPGLLYNKNTSAASSGQYDINIQGHSTLFSNDQPLIVVDNFAYDGPLSNLNPNDVESITVLKDASAASIYGVRSGNGVIVITTKKGKRGHKLTTEFNANVTIGKKPDLFYSPGFLDAKDYIAICQNLFNQGYFDGYLSDGFDLVSPAVQIMAQARAGQISSSTAESELNTLSQQDVRKDISKYLYRTSLVQQYAVNMSGGGAANDYFVSVGYDKNINSLVGNKNDRISISTTNNFYPTASTKISVGVNYVEQNFRTNSSINEVNRVDPYTRLADSKGNPLTVSTDYLQSYKDSLVGLGLLNWQMKPLAEIGLSDNESKITDAKAYFALNQQIIQGLSLDLKYQYERSVTDQNYYYSDSTYYARNLINTYTQFNGSSLSYPIPAGGILQSNNTTLVSNQVRGQLNFERNLFGRDDLSAIAGAEIRSAVTTSGSSVAYGYDKNTEVSMSAMDYSDYFTLQPGGFGSDRIPNNSGYSKGTNNFISYYSNLSYAYRERYSFSASGRIDHSNLFGVNTNQKAVPLYSVGLAWNISKEKFYSVDWLNLFKLRATFGYNANINTSAAAVTTISQYSNSFYNGLNYANVSTPGNPDLQWEKDQKLNFGMDYEILKSRIAGSFDFYFKQGLNLFGSSPLAPSTGWTSFYGNNSSTKGHGFDVVINTLNISAKKFSWSSNFLLSYAKDIVTKYNVKITPTDYFTEGYGNGGTVAPILGAPVFAIYSFQWGGLTHDTGDPQGYVGGKKSTDYATIINNASFDSTLQYNGTGRPLFFGALRNTFSFGRISLSVNILYKFDYYFRRSSMADIGGIGFGLGGGNKDYQRRWQSPGDELHTNVPSIQYPPIDPNRTLFYSYSSSLVDKADNIRIQDIRLSYNIGRSFWHKAPFTDLDVYTYLNNVGILWKANKDGLDPDVYTGTTGGFPDPKSISVGITAKF